MSGPDPVVFAVDDDPSTREALTSLLRSVGLGVETFGSAREFLTGPRSDAPGCPVLDAIPACSTGRSGPTWAPVKSPLRSTAVK